LGFNRLLCYGDFATYLSKGFGNGSTSFPSFEELKDAADGLSSIPVGCRILVKGSRYWKSELAVEWILNSNQNTMKSS
jgi:UDP-N-acetylmuramoyl-tripeptide--D-alanyl-D-alanine ligase